MPVFKSKEYYVDIPTDLTIWDFLFDERSIHSPLNPIVGNEDHELGGYVDAITGERLSWKDVKEVSTYVSTALVKKYGLKPNQTLAIFSRNSIWYPVALFAAVRAGGIVCGASPAYTVDEMSYALKTSGAKFLATHPTSIKVAVEAAKNAGIPKKHIFILEGELEGFTSLKELISVGKSYGQRSQTPARRIPRGKKASDVCALLSFSSGTTGLPKAVMISHHNVIADLLMTKQLHPSDSMSMLAVLPVFHITGLVHIIHLPILLNAQVAVLPGFSMELMLKAVVKYKITDILLVPPILIRLAHDPLVEKFDLSHLKRFTSGAAPISPEILRLLAQKFPGTGFKQGWGMSETTSCVTLHPIWAYDHKYASTVGRIMSNTEMKFIKEDGKEGGVGERGEILVRGPMVTMGYLGNDEATKESYLPDGFLRTGDEGFIDEEGFVTITDRIKEMIKVKGVQVAPAELEDLILGHDKVQDVAVVGIADDRSGERPKAFVVLKTGVDPGRDVGLNIMKFVEERRIRYKWIKEVEFIPAVPKSASGKILRRVLKTKPVTGSEIIVKAEEGEKAKL